MPEHLSLHQRVTVGLSKNRTVIGSIRFLGHTLFAPGIWVGVELTTRDGKNNGSVQGHYYFQCPMNYGLFIREDLVVPLPNPTPAPAQDQQPQQAVHPPNPPAPSSAHAVSFAPSPARPSSNSSSTHNRSHSHSSVAGTSASHHLHNNNNPIAAIRNEIKKTTSSETIKSNKSNNNTSAATTNNNSNNKMNSNSSSGKLQEESSREKKENSVTNNNSNNNQNDLQKHLSSDNTVWSGISDTNFSYQSSEKSHSPASPSKTTALKSSSVLKVKLSKMMELLNHQLELVEELEREEKKDVHSEPVLNLRKHIHEVTEEEIEILSSFQMKFTEFPAEQR
jgi:hypothetical protein